MGKISRNAYRLQWYLVVLAILGCTIWNNIPPSQQQNDAANNAAEEIARHLTQKLHQVGEECSRMTKACYLISDLGVVEKEKLVVMRQMILKESQEYCFTNVDLVTPEELSYKNSDTTQWPINKRTVRLVYARLMIASGFLLEGLKFSSQKPQNVLMIGLGGGLISNFFSTIPETKVNLTTIELDPDMEIFAKKWFGWEESPTNHVIIEDGVVFMREAAKKGIKYDTLLLDACTNNRGTIMCPVPVFLQPQAIKDISSILNENGVFAANLLIGAEDVNEVENQILNLFKKQFETCFLLRFYPKQRMLMCSHRQKWDFLSQSKRFVQNLLMVDEKFNFELTGMILQYGDNFKKLQ
ncbi:hypothetical protein ANCCAN_12081 [Ancylostoma caninum]|uniref:Spermine/spermidine synthase n=1 Tax=Ancylostoma caninum TaxID=29170 RepID=A0A368GC62_ANCCA|nr:hypothetical protein ANCCAN_12081 [Ancylostoma caninum]